MGLCVEVETNINNNRARARKRYGRTANTRRICIKKLKSKFVRTTIPLFARRVFRTENEKRNSTSNNRALFLFVRGHVTGGSSFFGVATTIVRRAGSTEIRSFLRNIDNIEKTSENGHYHGNVTNGKQTDRRNFVFERSNLEIRSTEFRLHVRRSPFGLPYFATLSLPTQC